MATAKDPTQALKAAAAALPDVVEGTSCNQTSFKAGKKAFLYVGPGAKGVGYKAMFKLAESMDQARELAQSDPECFGLGVGNWVTTRFSSDKPLPKKVWGGWLKDAYAAATQPAATKKKSARQ